MTPMASCLTPPRARTASRRTTASASAGLQPPPPPPLGCTSEPLLEHVASSLRADSAGSVAVQVRLHCISASATASDFAATFRQHSLKINIFPQLASIGESKHEIRRRFQSKQAVTRNLDPCATTSAGSVCRSRRSHNRDEHLTSSMASGGQPGSSAGRWAALQPSTRRPP